MSDPARMSVYLNMTKPERLRYWSEVSGGREGLQAGWRTLCQCTLGMDAHMPDMRMCALARLAGAVAVQ